MKNMNFILQFAAMMAIASLASATENIGSGKTAIGYKGMAASCNPASAQIDLDVNNVRTTLLNGGDMWWNLNDARYEIPKVDPSSGAPSVHSLFAGAIWMGGIDEGGQLKIAAQTYRQSGNDFWPGPLDNNASITSDVCNDYDRFWKVTRDDIEQLIADVTAAGGCISELQVPTSILEWPARGNTRSRGASGQFLTINEDLAPFYDANEDGIYQPECGDYPELYPDIKDVNTYGDQMIFWVYNDKGNIHTETGGQAIGIQVNTVAFAFATSDEVNDMTFYRYKIINKATQNIKNFYMAQWVDADLGCFNNDYVGCDTSRALGICYNGTATDPDCASRGYGNDPPMVGVDFFEGPLGDADTATGLRTKLGMSAFTYYNNDFSVTGNPETAVHYYNYMTGFWKDNTPFTKDQCTAKGGSMQTKFMFPSPPDLRPFPDYWSECSCNNLPADRRFLQSSGPFTLQPGAVNNITIGVVWVRPTGVYPCPSFEESIAAADDKAQALFNNFFKLVDGPDAPTVLIRELDQEIIISLVNNQGSNNIGESYSEPDPIAVALRGEVTTLVPHITTDNDTICYHPTCRTKVTFHTSTLPIHDPAAYDWDTIPTRKDTLSYCDIAAATCSAPAITYDSVISTTIDSSAALWITNVTYDASVDRMRLIVNDSPCATFCGTLYEFLPAAYGSIYLSNGCDSNWVYLGEGSPEFTADSSRYLTSDSCPVTSYAEKVDPLAFSAGDTITGTTSGATASVTSDDGMGNIDLVHLSGGFTDGEFVATDDTFKTVLHIIYDTTYTNIFTDTSIVNTYNDTTFVNYYGDTTYDNFDTTYSYVTTVRDPSITDTTYKFQGYRIFQLKNAQVSVQDLSDPTLARELFTVDLKDDIDKIVNFKFDPAVGADVPELKVDGENAGVRKSFRLTEDQFATGSKTLVNYKTYYFTAIAYAYNNYLPYDVGTGKGQSSPYLQGRKNFQKYSAIPHKWESTLSGTDLQSEYGDGVIVTRLDGTGNGGWNLDLTEASVTNILSSPDNFFGHIEYEPGKGPISVKVYDPMKVKKANFTLSMMDTTIIDTLFIRGAKDTTYISTEATWRLDVTNMDDGTTETIYAEKNISTINEQLITDYGISLSVNHVGLAGKAPDDYFTKDFDDLETGFIEANGFIEATIKFDDPENQWFTGVQDAGTFGATNWIRSGQYTEGTGPNGALPPCENFWDDHGYSLRTDRSNIVFYDPKLIFGGALNGTWTPYGLAANWVNKALPVKNVGQCSGSYSYGPAFPWKFRRNFTPSRDFAITENDLQNLQSVDVVLTDDKSKWTQCVVVELGEDSTLTEGFARKGNLRMHNSWNIDGNYSSTDTGRSWFPGYAINVETGERLNMMFGEDSWLKGEHGNDMIWNPTSNQESPVSTSEPLFGGKHYIYIMSTRYDNGEELHRVMLENFNRYAKALIINVNPVDTTALNNLVYSKIMWVSTSLLAPGYKLNPAPPYGNIIPSNVKIRLRVNVPYRRFEVDNSNHSLPQYGFSTDGLEARTQQVEVAQTACDLLRVVPNPYYAYSAYETSQLDNRVKITNLPDNCTVTIYTLGGTLIRQFNRAIGSDVSEGASTEGQNLDNSLDWDLKNNKDIPIASGVYLIHVKKDGVCEKVIKWFGVLRPIDLDTF